jgi:hypothetical protein
MIGFINTLFTLTHNHNISQSILTEHFFLDCRATLHSCSLSLSLWFDSILYYILYVSRRTHRKHIRCPAMDICEPHRKHLFLYCIYSALHSKDSYPIVACVFVASGMCLPSRCPATGLYVTIYKKNLSNKRWVVGRMSRHFFPSNVSIYYKGLKVNMARPSGTTNY